MANPRQTRQPRYTKSLHNRLLPRHKEYGSDVRIIGLQQTSKSSMFEPALVLAGEIKSEYKPLKRGVGDHKVQCHPEDLQGPMMHPFKEREHPTRGRSGGEWPLR